MEESKPTKKRRRNKKKTKPEPTIVADSSEASEIEFTFEEELEWCCNQALIDLTKCKIDPERFKDLQKGLRQLIAAETPFVKKRHMMRVAYGDYRHEMRTSQTLEQSRQKLSDIDMTMVEEQLGFKIPFRYDSAEPETSVIDTPLRSIDLFKGG